MMYDIGSACPNCGGSMFPGLTHLCASSVCASCGVRIATGEKHECPNVDWKAEAEKLNPLGLFGNVEKTEEPVKTLADTPISEMTYRMWLVGMIANGLEARGSFTADCFIRVADEIIRKMEK